VEDLVVQFDASSIPLHPLSNSGTDPAYPFRLLAESIPQLVWTARADGRLDYANQRWIEYTGIDADEIQGWPWKQTVHAEDLRPALDLWATVVDRQTAYESEYRLRRRDGKYRWFLVRVEPIFDQQGRPICWFGTGTDIDERKRRESQTEQRCGRSVEQLLDCLSILTAVRDQQNQIVDFRFDHINQTGSTNNGRTFEEQIGRGLLEVFPAHHVSGLFDEYRRVVETGEPLLKEILFYEDNNGGEPLPRWFDILASKLGDGCVAVWRDVMQPKTTERQAIEAQQTHDQQLRLRNEQLATVARVSQLLISGHHDNRQLLAAAFSVVAEAIGAEMYFHCQPHDADSIRLSTWHGLTEDERTRFETMRYGELLCGRVAAQRRSIVVEDIVHTNIEGSEAVRAAGLGAYAGFPLLAGDRLLGTVAFITRIKTHFADGEVQMIQTICDQVAAAIDRLRLLLELRENDERQRLAIEGAGLGTWDVDLSSGAAIWNPRQFELLGYAPEQGGASMGRWRERIHAEDEGPVMAQVERAKLDRSSISVEHRVLCADSGRLRWLSLHGRFYYDDTGAAVRFSGTTQDITERKQSEAELYASRQRLDLGTRVGGLALMEIDYASGQTQLTTEAARLFGLHHQACVVPREAVHATCHPDDFSALKAKIAACLDPAGDGWVAMTHRIIRPVDGSVAWVRVRKQVSFEGEGERRRPIRAIMAAVDVTAERNAEEAVRRSEALIRNVLDALPERIAVLDSHGVIVSVNEQWSKFARQNGGRLTAESPIGIAYLDLFQDEAVLKDKHAIQAYTRLGELLSGKIDTFKSEYPCHSPQNQQWYLMNGCRLSDAPYVVISHLDITERKQAEERLQFIADRARVGQWYWDLPHNQLEWSPLCKQLFGFSAGEAINYDRFVKTLHPDDRERVVRLVDACLAGRVRGNEHDVEYRVRWPDGTWRWIHAKGSATFQDGRPMRMAGIAMDITDRMQAQEAAAEHHELLETIFEYMPAAINIIRGSDLRLIMANREYRAIAPDKGDPVGKTLDELWPETGQDFDALCRKVLETGEPYHAVDELNPIRRSPDGPLEQCWFTWSLFRIRLPGDQGWGLFNSAWETTQRMRMELALRDSETRYRLLFENMSEGFALGEMIWDADGKPIDLRYLEVNRAWEQAGIASHQAIGRTARELVPDIEPQWIETFGRIVQTGQSIRYENYLHGLGKWFETFAFKHSENCLGVMFRDITQRKQIEERLRDNDRRKDEFIATLSHELRNPLATIRSGLEVMKLAPNDPTVNAETREMMQRQVIHLVALIDDLLDVSRISRGKIILRREKVSVTDAIHSAWETCQPMIEETGHELTLELPPETIFVDGDPHRLAQIFANLLNNAAKYTPRRGRIAVTAHPDGNDVVVAVKDTGMGIAKDQLTRVFDLFSQVENESLGYAGLGVGLSLVKSLVELHRGTIWAESAGKGQGSTFMVRLPVTTLTPRPDGQPASDRKTIAQAPRRVLIVDDNDTAAKLLSLIVKKEGHVVATALNGQDAVECGHAFHPEIVLMDIGMPVMDGYQAARAMRKEPWGNDITLVALTGWGQDDDKQKTQDAGFDLHLVKPVEPDTIRKLINELNAQGGTEGREV